VRESCAVQALRLSVYDAMIVASALLAGCRIVVSEDLQHGRVVSAHRRSAIRCAPREGRKRQRPRSIAGVCA
jgi:hypothetical protein